MSHPARGCYNPRDWYYSFIKGKSKVGTSSALLVFLTADPVRPDASCFLWAVLTFLTWWNCPEAMKQNKHFLWWCICVVSGTLPQQRETYCKHDTVSTISVNVHTIALGRHRAENGTHFSYSFSQAETFLHHRTALLLIR